MSDLSLPNHGAYRHRDGQADQISGDWIYVGTFIALGDPGNDFGTTDVSPPFQNGWGNAGDPWAPFAYRRGLFPLDFDGEITGGANGSVAFTIDPDTLALFEHDKALGIIVISGGSASHSVAVLDHITGDVTIYTS